jgi:putative ABC transport system permease protein
VKREIGTMKAIGAKNTFILALFMFEAFLIGILGATYGVLIGIGGGYVLSGTVHHSASCPGGGGGGGVHLMLIRYLFPAIFVYGLFHCY